VKTERIEVANRVLETFCTIRLSDRSGRLWMEWPPRFAFPAALRGDGTWPRYGYYQRPCGGTGLNATAQIIRYVRDLPRLPMRAWRHWASENVKLCCAETLRLLEASEYPARTACVLCGRDDWTRGLDWWSLGKIIGPVCSFGNCVEESVRYPKRDRRDESSMSVPWFSRDAEGRWTPAPKGQQ
jgi:hypothetical protein